MKPFTEILLLTHLLATFCSVNFASGVAFIVYIFEPCGMREEDGERS